MTATLTTDKQCFKASFAENQKHKSTPSLNEQAINNLFNSLKPTKEGKILVSFLKKTLEENGLHSNDPRLAETFRLLKEIGDPTALTLEQFEHVLHPCVVLISKLLKGLLIIPNFHSFCSDIHMLYEKTLPNKKGNVADYIPQLKRVNPEQYGISICTIDGQTYSLGESSQKFCVQSTCKPISYSLALEEHGADYVHSYIGREPSGRGFNELTLNKDGLPHNPMINSGAIMSSSLIQPKLNSADRFDYVMQKWIALSGGANLGFNNAVYLSERQTADRNFALAYFMKEKNAFPEHTNILDVLEFYFQCCSIETTTDAMAVMAATFANGGVVPTSGEKIFQQDTVKNCLSLMYSSGMYDFSGEFAFSVGLPAKSGVSGAMWIVVPNVMGICVWSPRLDPLGNSERGVEFCNRFVEAFNFHNYDSLVKNSAKKDPRIKQNETRCEKTIALCYAASVNDMNEIRSLVAEGVNLDQSDYDKRTALHLAASEGHLEVVEYLVHRGVNTKAKDRWGNCALDDAVSNKHEKIISLLKK